MRKIILAVLLSSAASVATAGNAVAPGPLQAVSGALFGFYPSPVATIAPPSAYSLSVMSASRTSNGSMTATISQKIESARALLCL